MQKDAKHKCTLCGGRCEKVLNGNDFSFHVYCDGCGSRSPSSSNPAFGNRLTFYVWGDWEKEYLDHIQKMKDVKDQMNYPGL
jgi:hypothetical protein